MELFKVYGFFSYRQNVKLFYYEKRFLAATQNNAIKTMQTIKFSGATRRS